MSTCSVAQSCPTLCGSMNCSPPGSSMHEIIQARTLEWVAISLLLISRAVMSDSLQPHGLQQASFPCPSLSPGVCSNSSPLSRWCHPTISSSFVLFSSCPQSSPVSGPFPMNLPFISSGQSIRGSASVLSVNIQGWFPLGQTGLISLLSKGLSRVFSSTTIWKHQFFGIQPSLWFNSNIRTWLLEKP